MVAQSRAATYRQVSTVVAASMVFMVALVGFLPTTAAAGRATMPKGRVVLVGVPGLRWSDVREGGTPNLWKLTGRGSAAALSVKTISSRTCPIGGWLTVSAGQRAWPHPRSCGLPPVPVDNAISGYSRMRDDNAHNKYGSELGLLGDAVHRSGACTMAVGPGAVFGAADRAGRVDAYAPSVAQMPADGWFRCALTMVDVDDIYRAGINADVATDRRRAHAAAERRTVAVERADEQVGRIVESVPPGTTVLVTGISDDRSGAHLHVALAAGPGYDFRYLTANSTHARGLVTLTDVTSTILHILHIKQPAAMVGSPWYADGGVRAASTRRVVHTLNDKDVAARAYRRLAHPFYLTFVIVQIALYAFATVTLRRKRSRALAVTRILALATASLPVTTYLANLVPWWSSAHPAAELALTMLAAIAVITAMAAAGPWRRSVTGSGAIVGGVTALVLTLDVMTGNHLQTCSMLGYTPLIGGRFYGFGNIAWALWITGVIVATGAVADRLLHTSRNRRLLATTLVVTAGFVALVIDGAPVWGADFGGIIATCPGFVIYVLMVSGQRIRLSRLLAVPMIGAVFVLGVAFLDSLRSEPTHIGEFWNTLTSGGSGTVVIRKFHAMQSSFDNPRLAFVTVASVGFLFFALLRPLAWRAAALHTACERAPALRATLTTVLVTAGVGMLVNDSGLTIPALAFTTAIPLALAAGIQGLGLDARDSPRPSERSERASAPSAL
ncbi:hypothetical protein [Actinoallomurus sp. NPDC052274]|uniref:hypothetical protein n=1 Tax=Actinoallomurus sp. NPDC052274 TaxID=3155420 RepID=UPI003413CD1F